MRNGAKLSSLPQIPTPTLPPPPSEVRMLVLGVNLSVLVAASVFHLFFVRRSWFYYYVIIGIICIRIVHLILLQFPKLSFSFFLTCSPSFLLYRQTSCFRCFNPVPLWLLGCPSPLGRSQCPWLCPVQIPVPCLSQF